MLRNKCYHEFSPSNLVFHHRYYIYTLVYVYVYILGFHPPKGGVSITPLLVRTVVYWHTDIRVFTIYLTLLGWKTYVPGKYYDKTDEPPNPRPTQNKKKQLKGGRLGPFFPQREFFRGLGMILYREQTTRDPTQPKISPNTLTFIHHSWRKCKDRCALIFIPKRHLYFRPDW